MNEKDLLAIESRLGIMLPISYRELQLKHSDMLKELHWNDDAINPLYLNAKHVIEQNLTDREQNVGTTEVYPDWWKTFFKIGTNGGGDYYVLRLDNQEGVWLIGSDCGTKPKREAKTLILYVKKVIKRHKELEKQKSEQARLQAPHQAEIDANLAMMKNLSNDSIALGWASTDSIYIMFEWLRKLKPFVSSRKIRLYGLGLCGLVTDMTNDSDRAAAIQLAKNMTLGKATSTQAARMRSKFRKKLDDYMEDDAKVLRRLQAIHDLFQEDEKYYTNKVYPDDPNLCAVYCDIGYILADYQYGAKEATYFLREVLGNPFEPVPFESKWRTPVVKKLAHAMFDEEQFDRMPELAIALQDASCKDERILTHCQRTNYHFRGCWVVDEILGKGIYDN